MATITEQGTLALKGEIKCGQSSRGTGWANQTIVVDVVGYNGTYRKIALKASTAEVQALESIPVGTKVAVTYQVTAREYQGNYYNNVDLYRIEVLEHQQPVQSMSQPVYQQPVAPVYPAPAAPAQATRMRPAVQSQPMIPNNMPMDLQQDDLPPEFYQ